MGHRALRLGAALVAIAIALTARPPLSAQRTPVFDTLSAIQKRLLVGLAAPQPSSTSPSPGVQAVFDAADASFRAAFVSITAALAKVSLSDHENGEILGVALDLIDAVEPLARQPAAAAAPERSQLSVLLAPGARDRLRRSAEFSFDPGTTTADLPAGYRQWSSPSLSLAVDSSGTRAIVSLPR